MTAYKLPLSFPRICEDSEFSDSWPSGVNPDMLVRLHKISSAVMNSNKRPMAQGQWASNGLSHHSTSDLQLAVGNDRFDD